MKRVGPKGSHEFERITWDQAYDEIVRRLNEIKAELETEEFTKVEKEAVGDAEGFLTSTENWNFVVVEFGIEDQGFPPGSKGYDGTAVRGSTIMRLTRELAEFAFKKAKEHEQRSAATQEG